MIKIKDLKTVPVKIKASDCFSSVLSAEGDLFTCGKGAFGRLGHGNQTNYYSFTMVEWFYRNGVQVRDMALGGRHCLAVSNENELYGWGFNFYYQLGQGLNQNEDEPLPKRIDLGSTDKIEGLSCGYFNSTVVTALK